MKSIYDEVFDLWQIEFTEEERKAVIKFGDVRILKFDTKQVDSTIYAKIKEKLEIALKLASECSTETTV